MRAKFLVLFIMFLITIFSYGLYGSPLYGFGDSKVDVEYINGILTASGILFGIWAILIERKPKERTKKWLYETVISESFFFSFAFLITSVLLVCLTAVDIMSSLVTLFVSAFSFFINAFLIAFTLHFYKFREEDTS